MIPAWLIQVLAENSTLDLNHTDGRTRMAEAIASAIPKDLIVATINESAAAVLKQKGIQNGYNLLSREIANNATQAVLLMLVVGVD